MILRNGKFSFETPLYNAGGFYSIIYMGVYEPILANLRPSDVVVDGGANIGVFSVLAAQTAKVVYALEPNPTNFRYLCRNLELNRVRNVVPLNIALSDRAGVAYVEGVGIGSHLASEGYPVHTVTIDELSREPITVAKLDIEGAEVMALMNMQSLSSIRLIVGEIDQPSLDRLNSSLAVSRGVNWNYDELYAHLRDRGFVLVRHNQIRSNSPFTRLDRYTPGNEIQTRLLGLRSFFIPLLTRGTNLLKPTSWTNDSSFWWMFYGFKDAADVAKATEGRVH